MVFLCLHLHGCRFIYKWRKDKWGNVVKGRLLENVNLAAAVAVAGGEVRGGGGERKRGND